MSNNQEKSNTENYIVSSPPVSGGLQMISNAHTGEEIASGLEDDVALARKNDLEKGFSDGASHSRENRDEFNNEADNGDDVIDKTYVLLNSINEYLDSMAGEIVLLPGVDIERVEDNLNNALEDVEELMREKGRDVSVKSYYVSDEEVIEESLNKLDDRSNIDQEVKLNSEKFSGESLGNSSIEKDNKNGLWDDKKKEFENFTQEVINKNQVNIAQDVEHITVPEEQLENTKQDEEVESGDVSSEDNISEDNVFKFKQSYTGSEKVNIPVPPPPTAD